jgi:hypothetical protein
MTADTTGNETRTTMTEFANIPPADSDENAEEFTTSERPYHPARKGALLAFVDADHTGPAAEFIKVTPYEAAYVLKYRNQRNRNLRESDVRDLTRVIREGGWMVNGETTKYSDTGELIDGQHRYTALAAVRDVPEDFGITMLVVAGLETVAQDTTDIGRRRTHSDVLGLNGYKHTMTLASTVRKLWWWDNGDRAFSGNRNPSVVEVQAFIREHPQVQRSAEVADRVRSKFPFIPQSVMGMCHYLFTEIDPDLSAVYFARLEDGAGLEKGHPILTMRESFQRKDLGANARRNPEAYAAYMIQAWNALRKNKTLAKMPGYHPERDFPVPS